MRWLTAIKQVTVAVLGLVANSILE